MVLVETGMDAILGSLISEKFVPVAFCPINNINASIGSCENNSTVHTWYSWFDEYYSSIYLL